MEGRIRLFFSLGKNWNFGTSEDRMDGQNEIYIRLLQCN